jgi:uncharacterized lipoprotein NlpE involved in copper resistance
MTRTFLLFVAIVLGLAGCDNRTQEARRWEKISMNLNQGIATQPFHAAKALWSSAEYPAGTAW